MCEQLKMCKIKLEFNLIFIFICIIICLLPICHASSGDRTQFFHNCRQNCERQNCSADGLEIQEQAQRYYRQTIFDKAFYWTCADECQYGCMWRTVDAFLERGWKVPQFYGKWPFVRFLGMQEPASVLFSIMNLVANYRMLIKFRKEVRRDSPGYNLWHLFAIVCINAWIWSTVFHTRDFPLTELLDYAFAYLMVLVMCYCTIMRMLLGFSIIWRGLVTFLFVTGFTEYFAYLAIGHFSYSFNMKVNIVTGIFTALIWLLWGIMVSDKRPYYRKLVHFYILFGMSMTLELLDFSPIFYIFDAHAFWHLSTVPVTQTFYNFIIEDCKALRKEKALEETKNN